MRGHDEDGDLHARRLAADAGRRGRARRAVDARGRRISFALADLQQRDARRGHAGLDLPAVRAAFLVKAPVFPLHGWMPDAYRAAPLPVLVVFSAVVSKVGVYGFLRIVLPLLPDAAVALPGPDARVRGRLDPLRLGARVLAGRRAARGRLLVDRAARLHPARDLRARRRRARRERSCRWSTTASSRAGLFFVDRGARAPRRRLGARSSRMGGMAFRAPVLAALLLILAFANLAMPGTPNFVGELLILFGAFEDKLAWGLVASRRRGAGVGLHDPVLHPGDAQPRRRPPSSRGRSARSSSACIAPLVAIVIALGVYPQVFLERTREGSCARRGGRAAAAEVSVPTASARARARSARPRPTTRRTSSRDRPAARRDVQGPEIDYEGLAPLFALGGGAVIVLMAEPLPRRASCSACSCPLLTLASLGAALGLTIWQWETGDLEPIVESALAVDTLALGVATALLRGGHPHRRAVAARRGRARRGRRRVLRAAARLDRRHGRAGRAPRTSSRCSSASSCSRSRCTRCARPSSAARRRSRPG